LCAQTREGYEDLQKHFWEEFALTHLKGSASAEADVFWKTMCQRQPNVSRDARDQFHRYQQSLQDSQRIKEQVLDDSLQFFTDRSKPLVQMLAVEIGFMPNPDVAIDAVHLQSQSFEGHSSVCDSSGFIKGLKRVAFPTDGPMSKFEALFDRRPIFNAIRESFFNFW
jgi:hypothetical protein